MTRSRHPDFADRFRGALLGTAVGDSLGGDTDTIAAMAGALAGAYHGYSGIPQPWRDVEDADRLIDLADQLLLRYQSQ